MERAALAYPNSRETFFSHGLATRRCAMQCFDLVRSIFGCIFRCAWFFLDGVHDMLSFRCLPHVRVEEIKKAWEIAELYWTKQKEALPLQWAGVAEKTEEA